MSLIAFHRFLISTAILFCLGFSVRQFSEFQVTGGSWPLILAIVFGIAAAALGYYLVHLRDFLRLPSRGAGGASPDVRGRSGIGGHPRQPGPTSLIQPDRPRAPGNGHDEQDGEEIRRQLKR